MPLITNILLTAYCSCSLCCGSSSKGITASGTKPKQGITIAGPRKFKLGSEVIIAGYTNHFLLQDRYNKHLSDRIDIYFNKHEDALAFGCKQHQTITIKEFP